MMHDLQQRAVPVGQHHLVGGDADNTAAVVEGLFVGFHGRIVTAAQATRPQV